MPSATQKTLAKFVLWSEVEDVYHRMDDHSVLALYQHLPRVHRKTHIYSTHAKLQELLKGPLPVSVSDNTIAFILIAKTRSRQKLLIELSGTYLKANFELYD